MLAHFTPASGIIIAMLIACFVMVLAFEATNGFHDTSNAVATVIYTHALKPIPAVIWSGCLNFVGVLVGGIAVAYTLVPPRCSGTSSPGRSASRTAVRIA
jgi:inorganic phosphate transporter, PiT family